MEDSTEVKYRKEIDTLISIRNLARENKDFAVADKLRDYLRDYWRIEVRDFETTTAYITIHA